MLVQIISIESSLGACRTNPTWTETKRKKCRRSFVIVSKTSLETNKQHHYSASRIGSSRNLLCSSSLTTRSADLLWNRTVFRAREDLFVRQLRKRRTHRHETDVRIDEEQDRSIPAVAGAKLARRRGALSAPAAPADESFANASQSFVDNIQASEETTVRTIRREFDGTAARWYLQKRKGQSSTRPKKNEP